ncbi:2625_t:CDS:2 [Entrophospora sp. SA101]|nr:10158_t:CDS:2 [Entrophospora sp. SA101]CAJ0642190.1 2625_t:CDS:2 [Entrophospora sp. SA101]CAJ0825329.1 8785_t:CDS:2 [Entrophospora sp. SA101]
MNTFFYLNPVLKPIFCGSFKSYNLKLNRNVNGTNKRPDFVCRIDQLPILNSEVKPMGDTIESFVMDLEYDGIYRTWPFMKTQIIIDKPSVPLLGSTLTHLIALEEQVKLLAENYKMRSKYFTPSRKSTYIRKLPISPQLKLLIK